MSIRKPIIAALAACLLVASAAFAQVPTGSIAGRVVDANGALPGVTVTATSEHLQGARTGTTTGAGDFMFPFLPPGEYRVTFELAGYQTVEATVKVSPPRPPRSTPRWRWSNSPRRSR